MKSKACVMGNRGVSSWAVMPIPWVKTAVHKTVPSTSGKSECQLAMQSACQVPRLTTRSESESQKVNELRAPTSATLAPAFSSPVVPPPCNVDHVDGAQPRELRAPAEVASR